METLKTHEAMTELYPMVDGLSPEADAMDQTPLWQRIEAYIAWRWTPRAVVWTVQGGGDWDPPLTPVAVDKAYSWTGSGWQQFEPDFGPIGFMLPDALCKIEAIAGIKAKGVPSTPPAAVLEAFRRLAEYIAASNTDFPGAHRVASSIGPISETYSRHPAHIARALVNSGAADLLRPYRRA